MKLIYPKRFKLNNGCQVLQGKDYEFGSFTGSLYIYPKNCNTNSFGNKITWKLVDGPITPDRSLYDLVEEGKKFK
jgi:hypothetical protein